MQALQTLILFTIFYISYAQRPSFLPSVIHKCVPDGNFCSVNADCCSRTCMSASSLCATSSDVRPQDNNINNRFSECQGVGNNCNVGQDCCSGSCSSFKCIENTQQNTSMGNPQITNRNEAEQRNCQSTNKRCSAQQDCCMFLTCEDSVCRDKSVDISGTETLGYQEGQYLNNRFGEGNQTESRPVARCMDVGQKCFKAEECCSPLKCHSFLHQCVT